MDTMTTNWTHGFIKPESLDKVIAQSKQFFEAEVKNSDADEQYTCGLSLIHI